MSVFYKFKAWRDNATIAFDGTGISVWDLKKEIITANSLAPIAREFDLHLFNTQTNEEYKHDQAIIARGTSILAQRLPARKSGAGTAARYASDSVASSSHKSNDQASGSNWRPQNRHSMSQRFDGKDDGDQPASSANDSPTHALADIDNDEAARIDAMFEQSGQQWEQTQHQMANARRIYNNPRAPPTPSVGGSSSSARVDQSAAASRKPPHSGYICYRCGQPGHWIQDCPTIEDENYNNIRVRRTTGIPKSFLQTVEAPTDENKKTLMLAADGGFVVARPDSASWLQHKSTLPKNLSANDVHNLQPEDPDLVCPIDSKLLKEAVKTPCCSTSFCKSCISKHLLDHDMICPECESRVRSLEQLKPDEDRQRRVNDYVEEIVRSTKEDVPEGTAVPESSQEAKSEEVQSVSTFVSAVPQDSLAKDAAKQNGDASVADSEKDDKARSASPSATASSTAPAAMVNPFVMQMQQLVMMLSNPALPPPVRMQMQMQLTQMQAMASMMMSSQQAANAQPPANAPTGPAATRNTKTNGKKESPRPSPFGDSVPKGPKALTSKRTREQDPDSKSNEKRAKVSS